MNFLSRIFGKNNKTVNTVTQTRPELAQGLATIDVNIEFSGASELGLKIINKMKQNPDAFKRSYYYGTWYDFYISSGKMISFRIGHGDWVFTTQDELFTEQDRILFKKAIDKYVIPYYNKLEEKAIKEKQKEFAEAIDKL